jgi:hypothetical protein
LAVSIGFAGSVVFGVTGWIGAGITGRSVTGGVIGVFVISLGTILAAVTRSGIRGNLAPSPLRTGY